MLPAILLIVTSTLLFLPFKISIHRSEGSNRFQFTWAGLIIRKRTAPYGWSVGPWFAPELIHFSGSEKKSEKHFSVKNANKDNLKTKKKSGGTASSTLDFFSLMKRYAPPVLKIVKAFFALIYGIWGKLRFTEKKIVISGGIGDPALTGTLYGWAEGFGGIIPTTGNIIALHPDFIGTDLDVYVDFVLCGNLARNIPVFMNFIFSLPYRDILPAAGKYFKRHLNGSFRKFHFGKG